MAAFRRDLEARARKAILQRAVFRLENAVLIAGALLLAVFFPQPLPTTLPWFDWWTWLMLGALGVAGIIWTTLTDREEAAKAVAAMFREEHDPSLLRDGDLQARYRQALEYYERLQQMGAGIKSEPLRARIADSLRQMDAWVSHIYDLALRLQAFRNDGILNRDRQAVPQAIRELERDLNQRQDPAVRAQLEANLASKRQQYENIRALDNLMKRAELQLDHSIAALGTVYSQLLLIGTRREIEGADDRRLQESITEEVAGLQDLVASINEIYNYRSQGLG
jgi:hypothetical protein